MAEPSRLLLKLSQRLFAEQNYLSQEPPREEYGDTLTQSRRDRAAFIDCLTHPRPIRPCILWCKPKPTISPFELEPPLSWQPEFVDRLAIAQKPGQHPLHNEGAFYCLDFSSIFAISTLLTISHPISLVVDMCASPGGKSIFAWVKFRPKLLLSNEVIGKRTAALISNLKRCCIHPATVLSLDSKILAEEIPKTAQIVLVDAPCTGQSLIIKGGKAPGCFHPVTINTNANRQKRILANSAQLVAGQGYLAYMTCTYSPEENEHVAEWFLERFPQFQAVEISHLRDYQSHLTQLPCYRLFPQQGLGAGAFTILLQNTSNESAQELPTELCERSGIIHL